MGARETIPTGEIQDQTKYENGEIISKTKKIESEKVFIGIAEKMPYHETGTPVRVTETNIALSNGKKLICRRKALPLSYNVGIHIEYEGKKYDFQRTKKPNFSIKINNTPVQNDSQYQQVIKTLKIINNLMPKKTAQIDITENTKIATTSLKNEVSNIA